MDEDAMDEHLRADLVRKGIDVVSAVGAWMQRKSDEEQLRYATAQGRVLYSFNVADYLALHRHFMESGESHAGIVLVTRDYYDNRKLRGLFELLVGALDADEMKDRVFFLNDLG